MIKRFAAALLVLLAAAAFAAPLEINQATQAELESIKGIGTRLSDAILDERKKGEFKDWHDLMARVKGVRKASAARFSAAGLMVNGTSFVAAPALTTSQPLPTR